MWHHSPVTSKSAIVRQLPEQDEHSTGNLQARLCRLHDAVFASKDEEENAVPHKPDRISFNKVMPLETTRAIAGVLFKAKVQFTEVKR